MRGAVFQANMIHREIEDTLHSVMFPKITVRTLTPLGKSPNLFAVGRMMRRFTRQRRQVWGPWRNNK